MSADGASVGGNRILNALPASEKLWMSSLTKAVTFSAETVLFEPGSTIDAVYFPTDGVISLVTPVRDGTYIEVATVGNEGVVGVPLVPPAGSSVRAISRVAGCGHRMDAGLFLESCRRSHALQTLVDRYMQALFCQISQTAACNRFHVSEERLSRWLLMHHDRIHSDHLMITQASLGQMLGTRRSTISVSAGGLQRAGLIRYARGRVTIIDRQGLEALSCECYAIIKTEFDRSARRDSCSQIRARPLL
jgi:CRP-like cAMP-binding protein